MTIDAASSAQASGAGGGTVNIASDQGAVALLGTIDVTATNGTGGNVQISALSDITIDDASQIFASGNSGGQVYIQSMQSGGGTLLDSGLIDGRGSDGQGGRVLLLAPRVGLMNKAVVDVSGDTGGGTVLAGGDFHGANPDVQNATRTYIGPNVSVNADAITAATVARSRSGRMIRHGFMEASAQEGERWVGTGGFVETSGKKYLEVTGARIDAGAVRGISGTWLLDPRDVEVVGAITGNQITETGGIFDPTGTGTAQVLNTDIQSTLDNGTNVLVHTGTDGADTGTITVNAGISAALATNGPVSLTFDAANNIVVNAAITATSDKLSVNLIANSSNFAVASGTGGVTVAAGITTNGGAFQSSGVDFSSNSSGAITTAGGNVTLAHTGNVTVGAGITTGGGAFASSGVAFDNTTAGAIITGGGNVTINHTGLVQFDAAINAAGGNATIISDSIVKGTDPSTLTAATANLAPANTSIGVGGAGALKTDVATLNAVAGNDIVINASQRGDARHRFLGGAITITNTTGNITLGTPAAGLVTAVTGVSIATTAGDILSGTGGSFTNISVGAGGAVTLSATAGAGAITGITVATDTPGTHTYSPAAGVTEVPNATVGVVTSAGGVLRDLFAWRLDHERRDYRWWCSAVECARCCSCQHRRYYEWRSFTSRRCRVTAVMGPARLQRLQFD